MLKLFLSSFILLSLSSCVSDTITYAPGEDSIRVASVGLYGYQPPIRDVYYFGAADNWYGGTPNYYSPATFAAWN